MQQYRDEWAGGGGLYKKPAADRKTPTQKRETKPILYQMGVTS